MSHLMVLPVQCPSFPAALLLPLAQSGKEVCWLSVWNVTFYCLKFCLLIAHVSSFIASLSSSPPFTHWDLLLLIPNLLRAFYSYSFVISVMWQICSLVCSLAFQKFFLNQLWCNLYSAKCTPFKCTVLWVLTNVLTQVATTQLSLVTVLRSSPVPLCRHLHPGRRQP